MTDTDGLLKGLPKRGDDPLDALVEWLQRANFRPHIRGWADAVTALRERTRELEKYAPPVSDRGGPRDPVVIWFDRAQNAEQRVHELTARQESDPLSHAWKSGYEQAKTELEAVPVVEDVEAMANRLAHYRAQTLLDGCEARDSLFFLVEAAGMLRSLARTVAVKDKEIARLSRAYNDAEDALSTIAVTVQPLQFKPRHDLVGNHGLAATVKQTVEALNALRADAERIDWMSRQCVTVRIPRRYGSREAFHGCPDLEEDSFGLRTLIDTAKKAK